MKHMQLILIALAIFAMVYVCTVAGIDADAAKAQLKAAADKAGIKAEDVQKAVKDAGDKIGDKVNQIKAAKGL